MLPLADIETISDERPVCQGYPLGRCRGPRSVKDVADVACCHGPLRNGECRCIDRLASGQKLRQRENAGGWAPVQCDDGAQGWQPRTVEGAECRAVELWAEATQRTEKSSTAKRINGDQGHRAGMLQHPGELARRRKGADRGDDGADLRYSKGGDDPSGPVRDQHRDPLALPD